MIRFRLGRLAQSDEVPDEVSPLRYAKAHDDERGGRTSAITQTSGHTGNDLVLTACLLHGTAHAALGAQDDLEYVLRRLREAWPDVQVHLRGDSGFGTPAMYDACEQLNIQYTIGMNARLKKHSDSLLEQAILQWEATGQPQRLFTAFWHRADSWPAQRWVVIKCEANAQGTNRRAVVTNRAGATVLPGAAYDGYADRGESENRNKELKTGLLADRLSDHRYFANLFRLYLHTAAYNLLVHMRRAVADPPHEPPGEDVPVEAFAGRQRRGWHKARSSAIRPRPVFPSLAPMHAVLLLADRFAPCNSHRCRQSTARDLPPNARQSAELRRRGKNGLG